MDCPDYESITGRPLVVGEPNENDVLLGRGNHVNYRPGNIRFRQLASAKGLAYTAASTKKEKDAIAAQLIHEVSENGGRFLREVASSNTDGEHLDAMWEVVTGQIVSTKVRQAMRDTMKAKGEDQATSGGSPILRGQRSDADITSKYPDDGTDLRVLAVAEKARSLLKNPAVNHQASQSGLRPPKILSQPISGFEDHSKPTSIGIHQLQESQAQSFPTGGHALNNDEAPWQPASATGLEGTPQQHMPQEQQPASQFADGTFAAYNVGLFGLGNPQCSSGPQSLEHLILQKTLPNHRLQLNLNQLVFPAGGQQLEETSGPLLQQQQVQLLLDPVQPLLTFDDTAASTNNMSYPPELPPHNGMMGATGPWIANHHQQQFSTMAVSSTAQDDHADEQNAMLQNYQPLPLFDHDASASCHAPPSEDYMHILQDIMDCA